MTKLFSIGSQFFTLARNYRVPVEFKDIPSHPLDRSLFCRPAYVHLLKNGLRISPIKIMHNATIHYHTRFRRSTTGRFLNALFDTMQSFAPSIEPGALGLTDQESSELQAASSEVIAVGLCVGVTSKLFNINKNLINPIHATGKRCDFRFELNGREYVIESKGRKASSSISAAVKDIFAKKGGVSAGTPKYGVVSYLPRDRRACSALVVDPDYTPFDVSPERRAMNLLRHYSVKANLAGFWRLSDLLDERANFLERGGTLDEIDQQPLEYGSVTKMGTMFEFVLPNRERYQSFFSLEQSRDLFGTPKLIAGLERRVVELLEAQDFRRLLLDFPTLPDATVPAHSASMNNDGSFLMFAPHELTHSWH